MYRFKIFLLTLCTLVCIFFVYTNLQRQIIEKSAVVMITATPSQNTLALTGDKGRITDNVNNSKPNNTKQNRTLIKNSNKWLENNLGSLTNFSFVLNCDICGSEVVDLLILVGTKPDYSDRRNVFRLTWQFPGRPYVIKIAFFVGVPDDRDINGNIAAEHVVYGDVIQGNFRDDYHNLTTRDLMSFRWAWKFCPQAKYVMHADDDVVLDIDYIYGYLERKMPQNEDFVACFQIMANTGPFRSGRYGISEEEYNKTYYDDYCQGWAYWMTIGAARQLEEMSFQHRPYWMNDAYLTGTLVKAMNWKLQFVELNYTMPFETTISSFKAGEYNYQLGISNNNELRRKIHELFYMKYYQT